MAVSSSNTTGSPAATTARGDKNKKQGKVVILKISPKLLQRFEPPSAKEEEQESTQSSASSPAPVLDDVPALKITEINDNTSESNSTPAPSNGDANSSDPSKKRKGPAPGYKRSLGQMLESNGTPKPRGKPGPKKKPRFREDGTIDHNATRAPAGAVVGFTGHKLGPKANQGAINAGLRALDRSGKPCRKWSKKPFQLKSFTGIVWDVPSWRGTENLKVNGDQSNDIRDISQQSSSDIKPNESDAAMDSTAGDQPDTMLMSTPAASSPVPMPEQTPIVAALG